jgi:hypothetical protein
VLKEKGRSKNLRRRKVKTCVAEGPVKPAPMERKPLMNAEDENQKARLERELEGTFWWARRDRNKIGCASDYLAAISGHQRFN